MQTNSNTPEVISVDPATDEVCCDGGGGALGHPVVWYAFAGQNQVECAYCDRLFVKKTERAAH
ncbi:MAG: zinc-finger domain-containing protein [Rhodospirillales bacterium]|nr:zinc-finger domain-containing protein [Rhodospirillales bacterium]MCB9964648.1 zinc-finger domain-containing protein [Rhodospirillales bacterium]MCB9979938.1 zinc-finger domain-containing protein [Rhodospirillales bacterium]